MELVIEMVPSPSGEGETPFCYVVGLRCGRYPEEGVGFLWIDGGWKECSVFQGPHAGTEVPPEQRLLLEDLDADQRRGLHDVLAGYIELQELAQLFSGSGRKLRLYEKPGPVDRYTAVVEGEAVWLPGTGKHWYGYGFGKDTSPQGFFQRNEVHPDADLGRPIRLADLPEGASEALLKALREDFAPDYPDLSEVI